MNNQRDIQIFELANRLMKLDVNTLTEQQLQQRNDMLVKLKEEIKMLDEASLATMRDYFAGNDDAHDPMDITKQRLHFAKDKNARPTVDKRFNSPAEYQAWLKQNKLKSISSVSEDDIDEGWKDKVAAGALAATMALGAAGAHARVTPGEQDPGINRLTGKPIATQVAPADQKPALQAPAGFSKEYLQSVVNGTHPRPMVSVEKAQQLLKQMGESVTEEFNGEYDDEAGMAKSNLRTMARAVNGLLDTIEDNDNLPEWAQEKLAKAEMMTTSVWDYLLSQKEQGMDPKVTEAAPPRVDSLVTDTLRIMKGPEVSDAVNALKTVLGDREYNGRRGHYNFYVRQILDMYRQQGVTETKKPSPKLTAVDIKKTAPVSEEINTEAYERLQKVFAFKNYES